MMLLRYYSQFDGQPMIARVASRRFRIGSESSNDITLSSPFVDAQALDLCRDGKGWKVRVVGKNGCELDGTRYRSGEEFEWNGESRLVMFPYAFVFDANAENSESQEGRATQEVHELITRVHLDLLEQMHHGNTSIEIPKDTESLLTLERSIESMAVHHGLGKNGKLHLVTELAGSCVRDALLGMLLESDEQSQKNVWKTDAAWAIMATAVPDHESELRRWVLVASQQLFRKLTSNQLERKLVQIERHYWNLWDQLCPKMLRPFAMYLALRQLKKQLKDILFGFGPLEDLLRIPTISEIMVNSSQEIFIERAGKLQNSGRRFVSDEVTQTVIERIVGSVGRRIDTAQPMVDARLPDGSRVNAVIPPLAVKGPCITIRKFAKVQFDMSMLIERGSITAQCVAFLEGCVRGRKSMLVSGGTGTGKTTLLNCLSMAIPNDERIICIEDTHELQLQHPHVVFVECRDGNNEGKGRVTIRDLVRNALRQRPDRVIVGECRSDEALDMLQAMNTGHSGSLTTIHANTPGDALRRLEVLVRESNLPADAIRQQIVSAIDVVVQIERLECGTRRVSEVSEVIRFDPTRQCIELRPLFHSVYDPQKGMRRLLPTGSLPSFACELVRDRHISLDLFLNGIDSGASA